MENSCQEGGYGEPGDASCKNLQHGASGAKQKEASGFIAPSPPLRDTRETEGNGSVVHQSEVVPTSLKRTEKECLPDDVAPPISNGDSTPDLSMKYTTANNRRRETYPSGYAFSADLVRDP